MAEQTNTRKTISFAGRTLDQNDLVKKARAYAQEWMNNQGLKGDKRADFESEFNDILDGLTTGRYTITDSGALAGKGAGKVNSYNRRTGARIENGGSTSGKLKEDYSAAAHVVGYLNGLAGRMSEISGSTAAPAKETSSTWNKSSSMGRYVADQIFGEGNDFSKEQLVRWADAYDAAGTDGSRGITGRSAFIKDQLKGYRDALLAGKFGELSDEDKQAELAKIEELLGTDLTSWTAGKNAPWLSHFLFTDSDYYQSDAERQAAATAAESSRVADALQNGGNPYAEGTAEYEARAQQLRQQELNEGYTAWMNSEFTGEPTSVTFESSNYKTTPEQLAQIVANMKNVGPDYMNNFYQSLLKDVDGGFDALASSYNPTAVKGHSSEVGGQWSDFGTYQMDLNGLRELANDSVLSPFTSVISPDKVFGQHWGGGSTFSPVGYKQFAYATVLEMLKNSGDLDDYKVAENEYALIDTMDKDGNLLVYKYSPTNPTIEKTNIRKYKDTAPDKIWGLVGDRYAAVNEIDLTNGTTKEKTFSLQFKKEGGVIKAQQGTNLFANTPAPSSEPEQPSTKPAEQTGLTWDNLSGVDKARIAGMALDVSSLIAAFVPDYGTIAGLGLGAGSTATNTWADFKDPNVSSKEAWTGLASNVGLDLLSLIPFGGGTASGLKKIARTAAKSAPIVMSLLSVQNLPDAAKAFGKLTKGENLTSDELRDLGYGLSMITGIGRGAVSRHNSGRRQAANAGSAREISYRNGEGVLTKKKISAADFTSINESTSNSVAEAALRSATGDAGATFAHGETFVKKGLNKESLTTRRKKLQGDKVVDFGLARETMGDIEARNRAIHEEGANGNWFQRTREKLLPTNDELAFGGRRRYEAAMRSAGVDLNPPPTQRDLTAIIGKNRVYDIDAEARGIYDSMQDVNRWKHEAASQGDMPHLKRQLADLDAAIKADEGVLGVSGQDAVEAHLGKVREAAAKHPTEAPKRPNTDAFDADIKKLEADETLWKQVIEDGAATSEEKAVAERELAATVSKLAEKRKSLDDFLAPFAAEEQTWKLAQEAERQGEVGARLLSNYSKQRDLNWRLGLLKDATHSSSRAYKAVSGRLKTLKKLQTEPIKSPKSPELQATAERTLDIEPLEGTQKGNFRKFIKALSEQGLSEGKIMEILQDPEALKRAKNAYKFMDGGTLSKMFKAQITFGRKGCVIKAYVGTSVPEPEKPKDVKPTTVTGLTGTIGGATGTIGSAAGTIGGGNNTPSGDVINPFLYDTKKPAVGYGVNPTDLGISALESSKYGLTQGINGAIYQTMAGMRGVHEMPFMQHYRQWSAKPLLDQMASNTALYRQLGANSAAGTSDQNMAFAYNLAATTKGVEANKPLAIQANEQIKTTVDQQNAVGIANAKDKHDVGWRNKQGDVALSNARLKAFADYLHKLGTTASQNIMARQYGMAKAGIANDNRAYQAAMSQDPTVSQAKATWQELARKRALNKDSVSDAEYREAQLNYQFAVTQFTDFWNATHIGTTGTPYAGYGTVYDPTGGDFFSKVYRRGGKMEAAEREKTRREYEKIYHDSMKLMVTESNKKLRNSAYAFYRKLFMHAK